MADHSPHLAHHFEDLEQQREACELGMWLFLVTEFMFFGGLFLAYLTYRYWHLEGFIAGSRTMDVTLGTVNTAILLGSSFTMALAVYFTQNYHRKWLLGCLLGTILLGTAFLGVKAYEYHHKYEENLIPFAQMPFDWEGPHQDGVKSFLNLYFLMTGLHAFHMIIGLVFLVGLAVMAWRDRLGGHSLMVHNFGLYWHFVDLVWVYLFPFFYLVAARGGVPEGSH